MALNNAPKNDTEKVDPNAVQVEDNEQTWIVAKDNEGKDQRIKTEEYAAWEQDQARERK